MDLIWDGFVEAIRLILRADSEVIELSTRSLLISSIATLLAAAVGIPLGVLLATARFRGQRVVEILVNTGMALPPVVVGLVVSLLLWRTGPFGPLQLLYTPAAMVIAQFIVAAPIAAGLTRSSLALLDPDLLAALRVDGASSVATGRVLVQAALPQVLVAIAAAFGRAIAEVGASLMVGGNIAGQTRILTTAITLETSRGNFALAIALGIVLLAIAFLVNLAFVLQPRLPSYPPRWSG